jgi:hypothetical protein
MSLQALFADTIRDLQRRLAHLEGLEAPLTNIGARVYNSANIPINNGAVVTVTFNSERWDTDGIHSTSSNTERLTAQRTGKYYIWAGIRFSDNGSGFRQLEVRRNGTTPIASEIRVPVVTGFGYDMTIATVYDLNAGDYVTLVAYQNSGANLNLLAVGNLSPEFLMHRLP